MGGSGVNRVTGTTLTTKMLSFVIIYELDETSNAALRHSDLCHSGRNEVFELSSD
jgi:hypothetical protein